MGKRILIRFILLFLVILAFDLGAWLLDALVLLKLWNWFVGPVTSWYFSYWGMFGALLIPSLLHIDSVLRNIKSNDLDEEKDIVDYLAESFVNRVAHIIITLMLWGIGALIA